MVELISRQLCEEEHCATRTTFDMGTDCLLGRPVFGHTDSLKMRPTKKSIAPLVC